ncbi:tryptophan 7-halogenase [Sphingomonas sp. RIT328]|uniref:tryptophan 7-halogenase n=1 Tax=Sphingomonas sp. RIT328 TaxID=1470591 RepID=UPI00044D6206|nr:tryptophan 7-halogenase [Sphingomonas sp. RIT328]EZP51639.1 Tryptophan halogenase precursor [Sphingomonas sp. RIT328]
MQTRDVLILPYKVTERRDGCWRYGAAMPIPDSRAQKIELFRETRRAFRRNEELFAEQSWVQVMMGQGIMPRSHHPIAANSSDADLARLLDTLRRTVAAAVRGLPDHASYVAHHGGIARDAG